MLDAVGDYFDGKLPGVADSLLARLPVGHYAGEFQSLGYPTAVIFPVEFNGEVHPFIVRRKSLLTPTLARQSASASIFG